MSNQATITMELVEQEIETMGKNAEIELDVYDWDGNCIIFEIKTPYDFDDEGREAILGFVKEVTERYPKYIVVFEEDIGVKENEYDCWIIRDGWLRVYI